MALALLRLAPAAGLAFLPVALATAAATVLNRYHYAADALVGALFALAAAALAGG